MARSTMQDIIVELRTLTDASQNEVTVNGVEYWTDDQLELVLDEYGVDLVDVELVPVSMVVLNVREWRRYYFPVGVTQWVERGAAFTVVDTLGNAAPENTVNFMARLVTFTTNTSGRSYYIRSRMYDMRGAAAKVWLLKAGHRANLINWQAGNQKLEEDGEWQHCMEMYKLFSGFNSLHTIRLKRVGYGLNETVS